MVEKIPAFSRIQIWPPCYKKNFMLNSAEHEIFPAQILLKMPTIVGILTIMNRKNSIFGLAEFLDAFILMSI